MCTADASSYPRSFLRLLCPEICQSAIVISVLVHQGVTVDNSIEAVLLSFRSTTVIEQQQQ